MRRRPTLDDIARVLTSALRARRRRRLTPGQRGFILKGGKRPPNPPAPARIVDRPPLPPLTDRDGGRRGD